MNALVDAGSFRDPAGRVFVAGERVFRTVMPQAAMDYERFRDDGLMNALIDRGLLVGAREVQPEPLGEFARGSAYLIEHPRVPFVSYPYEWSFSLHKRAALHHLDVQLEALDAGFALVDATAYNIQFDGTRPVFIDHLSFRAYRDGEIWRGHRQFCMQFLNPLLMTARLGIPANAWFRGSLEGIAPEELAPLLSWRDNLSWTVLTHVTAQAALQKRSVRAGVPNGEAKNHGLSRTAFHGILEGLRRYIAKLEPQGGPTVWGDYADANSYGDPEAAAKRRFVGEMVDAVKPGLMFDIGCNSGDYSQVALDAGASRVIGFDFDHGALERAFHRFDGEDRVLPLWLDAANPSPAQGWGQRERKGLAERAKADALVALAFVHHIAIGRNVPMDMMLDWLLAMAPVGVIEFPPKSDPMVQCLLSQREDIFPDYDEAAFLTLIGNRARIVRSEHLSENGRLLVWYDRTN
ncbi:MAG: class I SAM-dependent methyltransferase [Sphingomonas sp.]